ncbi:hypothetical protein CO054_00245 [Candidatus Shapirobacteria bacterium CG_4_9_14_0_2_um_filter_39_11]|uniref:Uncharacterized protein n=1 Tax=Candidatus Shapirobacteria bacterium CG_4_9_14_0_2_um_filter_39_11 TaxID=1974478 RepID=A0A2M8ETH3_9BACT|nr:MAG: hypothetical protein CO054_00245 [Candidatus Shapirobacteria bacterium CG_4_9_14_0_2_um_filter_39_11]
MATERIEEKIFEVFPVPKLDKNGKIVVEIKHLPADPYSIRLHERIGAGELPPNESPVELAQNE